MPAEICLQIDRLELKLKTKNLLHPTSLQIMAGRKIALLGLNGAGKTSFLKLLTGVAPATGGQVLIDGLRPVADEIRARLGYQADQMQPLPQTSGLEYLTLVAALKDISQPKASRQISSLVTEWLLGAQLDKPMTTLSKGNLQKLMILQALLGEPRYLVFDEPSQALDPEARRIFSEWLVGLTDFRTCIFSTHQVSEALALADHVLLLHQGRLLLNVEPPLAQSCLLLGVSDPQRVESYATKLGITLSPQPGGGYAFLSQPVSSPTNSAVLAPLDALREALDKAAVSYQTLAPLAAGLEETLLRLAREGALE